MKDGICLRGRLVVAKYDAGGQLVGTAVGENMFLTVGATELWSLVCGTSTNVFDEDGALIGIGDNSTASTADMKDLQAVERKIYRPMESGFPIVGNDGSAMFEASFGPSEANHEWREFVVRHAASGICLDRGVGQFGIKSQGSTWVATVTLSIA